jgi:hypothetical protein
VSIIRTSRNKRHGMTTLFATLIFVSMIFTALIPLQMSMLQTDTYESQMIRELETIDNEKAEEELTVVSYPTTSTSSDLKVRVQNTGILDVKIVKVWIKDEPYDVNDSIAFGEAKVLGPFSVDLMANTSYPVKVITERGNLFGSNAGNMIYSSSGIWFTPSLGVNVYIANDKGKYYVEVSNSTWSAEYSTQGQDFGDLVIFFEVDTIDTYHVICKKNSASGKNLVGTPVDVTITWPNGSPIVFVFTSGLDV